MSVKFLKNSKDSFITSLKPTQNFGIDEILEVGVSKKDNSISKILLSINSTEIQNLKTNFSGSNNEIYLKLYLSEAYNTPESYYIELYELVNDNWLNGIGKKDSNYYSTEGINYTNYLSTYDTGKRKISEDYFSLYSNKDLEFNLSGSSTYSYSLNVKNDETLKTTNTFSLNYFSKDTNTVYSPQVVYKFDDSQYTMPISGSVISSKYSISMKNNLEKLYSFNKYRLNINARDMNPVQHFIQSSLFSQKKYLPTTSYYAIRDIKTGIYLIDFDINFTKISLDSNGNYFTFYTENIETNRYYAVDLKIVINNNTYITHDNYIFRLQDK